MRVGPQTLDGSSAYAILRSTLRLWKASLRFRAESFRSRVQRPNRIFGFHI